MTDLGRLGAFITKVKKGSLADVVGHLRAGKVPLLISKSYVLYAWVGGFQFWVSYVCPLSKQAIFMQAYRYFSGYEYLIDCHNRQLYMNSSLERMSQIFSFIKNK